jgi:geranylgeranyl diphosphate synthase type II
VNLRLKGYIEEAVPEIDAELFRYLPGSQPLTHLYGPMRDRRERAMATAAAFEMFQSFALVHDDIEDGSEMRRGKPCLHRIHGVPLSINVGDALYSKVFEVLAANRAVLGDAVTMDLIEEMVAGARMTFEGQAYDIGWVESGEIPTVPEFMNMLRLKTGWYSGRGPCTAGAIIAGAPAAGREAIGDFGETMAVAFQIRDDLLNLTVAESDASQAPTGTEGGYGKERGGDIAEGKRTLMVIDLFEHAEGAERERVREILDRDRDATTHDDVEWVIGLMRERGSIARAQEACERRAVEALSHLDALPDTEARDTLREMCAFLVERVF